MPDVWKYLKTLLLLAAVFVLSLRPSMDPDLGWHLKYGEYFWQHGQIQRLNPYSISLPNYRWVNISWGYDALTYVIYRAGGFAALSLAAAGLITLSVLILIKAIPEPYWLNIGFTAIYLWVNIPIFAAGWRSQVFGSVYFALVIYGLARFARGQKTWMWGWPVLFWLWANTHGSFILGLALLGLWGLAETVVRKRISREFWGAVIPAGLVTLINPYGVRIYREVLWFMPSEVLTLIQEWKPPLQLVQTATRFAVWLVISAGIAVGAGIRIRAKPEWWPWVVTYLALLVLTWQSARYLMPLTIFAYPLLPAVRINFKPAGRMILGIFGLAALYLWVLVFVSELVVVEKFWAFDWKSYCTEYYIGCSDGAAKYIIDNKLNREDLLTPYIFGGWLIWNYPQIKPYTDGHMQSWQENGFSPFVYYSQLERNRQSINESGFNTVFTTKDKAIYRELEELVALGQWSRVYDEPLVAIYTRRQ